MGCKYWECKFNKISNKGKIGECKKPNGSNIRRNCPNNPIIIGDFCSEGEARDNENISEYQKRN